MVDSDMDELRPFLSNSSKGSFWKMTVLRLPTLGNILLN